MLGAGAEQVSKKRDPTLTAQQRPITVTHDEGGMHIYLRGSGRQHLRLASGLVLFAFATAHFLNHAVGLISLEAMHQVQEVRTAVTRSWPVSLLLLAALVAHVWLALAKLALRKTWRIPRWEAVQIGLGLAIPFLLLPHIVNTRVAHLLFGVNDIYLYELLRLWPDGGVTQSALLILVWTHGCLGLHFWLRLSPLYRRLAPLLLLLALAVPVLALSGFVVAGRETGEIMSDPDALSALKARTHWPDDTTVFELSWLRNGASLAFAGALAAVAATIILRQTRHPTPVKIRFAGGPAVDVAPGMTLLEVSRSGGVPHAAVCGGRARCSTCRVRIDEGLESLPPAKGAEAATLRAIGAEANVRLACQVRPTKALSVTTISHPLVPTPIERDFAEIRDVVAAHVRAVETDRIADRTPSDHDGTGAAGADQLPFPVVVPDFTAKGFAFLGYRLDYILNIPAVALAYLYENKVITVLVMERMASPVVAVYGQYNSYHVHSWDDAAFDYVAVSASGRDVLDRLQDLWRVNEAV